MKNMGSASQSFSAAQWVTQKRRFSPERTLECPPCRPEQHKSWESVSCLRGDKTALSFPESACLLGCHVPAEANPPPSAPQFALPWFAHCWATIRFLNLYLWTRTFGCHKRAGHALPTEHLKCSYYIFYYIKYQCLPLSKKALSTPLVCSNVCLPTKTGLFNFTIRSENFCDPASIKSWRYGAESGFLCVISGRKG